MQKRMSYSLYKKSYSDFPSSDYDSATKTILVTLPDYKKPSFPKEWRKTGNYYIVSRNTRVICWNSGYSENFVVESADGRTNKDKTFPAGLYTREKVIDYVSKL